MRLELLAPARDAEIGIEAVKHGADAVYIGGPAFGARAGAANSLADIARLTAFAQRFHARVLVAFNTIFADREIEAAGKLAWQLYDTGIDALIVQDMGLLELDLPPLQLHASTQCDIRTPEKAHFLQNVGFSQIVLARELPLDEIRHVRAATDPARCTLEHFIHGALCVSYSGQCYLSFAQTGRSANRGECAQLCRLPYTLADAAGQIVAHDKHLLSLKDNDQSANLGALIEAGIRSFKIEGRYKDMAYVKNATAHYRQLLDAFMTAHPEFAAASSGRVRHLFTPQPEKSFNRGATDYFTRKRQDDIAAFETPKFAGEAVGVVKRLGADWLEIDSAVELHNGDGLSFQATGSKGADKLEGMRINVVEGRRLFPHVMPKSLRVGTLLYRNRDQAFERQLEKESAERRIAVRLRLHETDGKLQLSLSDADGISVNVVQEAKIELARDAEKALAALKGSLGKFGNTDFEVDDIVIDAPYFVPVSAFNALRRKGIAALTAARAAGYARPPCAQPATPPVLYPARELSYLGNVFNAKAREFYRKHGVELIADAFEAKTTAGEVSLMITKHCLRYSFKLCPKQAKEAGVKGIKAEPMTLVNGKEKLKLVFDCKACEMHVVGRLKAGAKQLTF